MAANGSEWGLSTMTILNVLACEAVRMLRIRMNGD